RPVIVVVLRRIRRLRRRIRRDLRVGRRRGLGGGIRRLLGLARIRDGRLLRLLLRRLLLLLVDRRGVDRLLRLRIHHLADLGGRTERLLGKALQRLLHVGGPDPRRIAAAE